MLVVWELGKARTPKGCYVDHENMPIGLTPRDLMPQRRAAHCTPNVRLSDESWSTNIPPFWGGGTYAYA
jgi:hypothetical protein